MFYHLILGLLRNGRPRHGYELITEFRARSGHPINPGNFYRECNKLVSQGLIAPNANPPDADPRRIPYRITQSGSRDFDDWLLEPRAPDASLDSWVIFADMLLPEERLRLLDRMREELWMNSKVLAGARDRVMARGRRVPAPGFNPAAFLMLRRVKQIAADLEFLKELRQELEHIPPGLVGISSKSADAPDASDGVKHPAVALPVRTRKS
jgi:DNA-binding PadR family transcriptional regulator